MSAKVLYDPSHGRPSLEPALFPVSLRYHSIPIERLAGVTTRRLAEAGLPASCLGRLDGRRVTLTGCVVLPPYARGSLPPGLGGDALDFAASASTADLIDKAVQRSPLRGRVPTTPRLPTLGAHSGGGGSGGAPSPPSPSARMVRRELATEEAELEREEARFDGAFAVEAAARERLAAARRDSLRSASSGRAASEAASDPARAEDAPEGAGRRMEAAL